MVYLYNNLYNFVKEEARKHDMEVIITQSDVFHGIIFTFKKYEVYKSCLVTYKTLFTKDIDKIKFDIKTIMRRFLDDIEISIV